MSKISAGALAQVRCFSSSSTSLKAGCSIVKPVHHTVKIIKSSLSERYREKALSKNDIRSPGYKPTTTHQDRVKEYYENTIKPDMLLINYVHEDEGEKGISKRPWDFSSPYHLNRPERDARGKSVVPRVKPRTHNNVPELTAINVSSYVPDCKSKPYLHISVKAQLAQLTNKKPQTVYSSSNVVAWKLREGMKMGGKVELKGREMHQFFSTLTEIVLPQSREFEGIGNGKGDKTGNISFGLDPSVVKHFPEVKSFPELFPTLFGMKITLQTTAQTDSEARTLLSGYGLPFVGSEKSDKVRSSFAGAAEYAARIAQVI